jgi:hypothetical protein
MVSLDIHHTSLRVTGKSYYALEKQKKAKLRTE